MTNKNKDSNFLQFFIIFLTSFIGWIFFSYYIGHSTDIQLLKSDKKLSDMEIFNWEDLDLKKFWKVYKIMDEYSYDIDWVNEEELVQWAIRWLVDWLGDKYSVYFSKKETQRFNQALSWDFEWIWAFVEKNELWVVIDRLMKGSPAKKAWIRSWDIIIKANNEELQWLSLHDAVDKIKWPANTKVLLEILRPWEKNILKIEVTRAKIVIPSVEYEKFEETNTWYISINKFWERTSIEVLSAIEKLKETDWIIIDLRDNWGGYLLEATAILSNFIENGKVLVTNKYKGIFEKQEYTSINDWDLYKWKVVVIINENSASASEITAWALKDYKKAILVWKKSYWKGSVQKPFELWDESMIKLTIAKWFTPEWINIDKEGIIPDIEISFIEEDYDKNYDRQLESAKEILDIFIKNNAYTLSLEKSKEKFSEKENK